MHRLLHSKCAIQDQNSTVPSKACYHYINFTLYIVLVDKY